VIVPHGGFDPPKETARRRVSHREGDRRRLPEALILAGTQAHLVGLDVPQDANASQHPGLSSDHGHGRPPAIKKRSWTADHPQAARSSHYVVRIGGSNPQKVVQIEFLRKFRTLRTQQFCAEISQKTRRRGDRIVPEEGKNKRFARNSEIVRHHLGRRFRVSCMRTMAVFRVGGKRRSRRMNMRSNKGQTRKPLIVTMPMESLGSGEQRAKCGDSRTPPVGGVAHFGWMNSRLWMYDYARPVG
jgi:hypothetical protein